jgi:hypothetical protein
MNHLVTALNKIIAKEIQQSGNLENRLREIGEEARVKLADATHEIAGVKPEEIFQIALDLGRDIRQKTVYGMEVDRMWYYFVGTENEIIQKLESVSPGDEELDDEANDAIEDLDKLLT